MIFEYVVKNCSGGGIIVFEDLDCQTDIVKPRQNQSIETKLIDIIDHNDDQLNLAYFLNMLDGSLCLDDTIYIITTNHLDHIDPAIYRKGRVDLLIHLEPCDHYQIRKIYQKILNEIIDETVLKKIPELVYPPCEIIFHLVQYIYNKRDCTTMLSKFIST
jgi:hypothetical protein